MMVAGKEMCVLRRIAHASSAWLLVCPSYDDIQKSHTGKVTAEIDSANLRALSCSV
jgi:hypothetical protein